jgi:sugar diacid utilization regulator
MSCEFEPPEQPESTERRLAAATQARTGRELADDLLDGATNAVSSDELLHRARELGHDPHRSYRALAFRWAEHALDESFVNAVQAAARGLQIVCWTTRRDQAVIAVAQRLDGDAWADTGVWQALHTSMARALPKDVGSIGVGGLAPTQPEIPRSYRQAQQALRIRRTSAEPHGVTIHDQLGIPGLVANPGADDFVQEWLTPLLDYDQQHATELTETLATYLTHAGHYGKTADALHIQRSTVRYRLHSIRNLIHHDLGDPEIRFNLQLATRIWQGIPRRPGRDAESG